MTNKHTPTPWRVHEGTVNFVRDIQGGMNICVADDVLAANAEFIVRAVNAHDELLESAKAVLFEAEATLRDCGCTEYEISEWPSIMKCRAAINKAEGK